MIIFDGSVTSPKGFKAAGIHAGIRKNKDKKDLALILADGICNAAAVYTLNKVKGAPLIVTKQNLADGKAAAIVCNSGNANTCNPDGEQKAAEMCRIVAECTGVNANDVIVASTGVIGLPLSVEPIKNAMPALVKALGDDGKGAAQAIMTTDTVAKTVAAKFVAGGKECVIGGIAKGSGMIHPNMATMLVFLTTDANISSEMLQKAISDDVKRSFNMVSVDGDTSTNDMLAILAGGKAGNPEITTENDDYKAFIEALNSVTVNLCKKIAKDGEGATKLLECKVTGGLDYGNAAITAKSVITSSLFKAAMFGADANWGRALCAIGYSGANTDTDKIDIAFSSAAGSIDVCRQGKGLNFDEVLAKKILSESEITVTVTCRDGDAVATAWGCDLTYDYVKINGDYRT